MDVELILIAIVIGIVKKNGSVGGNFLVQKEQNFHVCRTATHIITTITNIAASSNTGPSSSYTADGPEAV